MSRLARAVRLGLALGLALAGVACKSDGRRGEDARATPGVDVVAARDEAEPRGLSPAPAADPSCLTMRSVDAADVVRVDEGWAYYVRPDSGLTIYDLHDPAAPRFAASSPFRGGPASVFVGDGVAYVVFADWESSPARSVVRALDVRRPDRPVVLGEAIVGGVVRDARRVSGTLYVLAEEPTEAPAGAQTTLSSFGVHDGALRQNGRLAFEGDRSALAMSPYAAAVVLSAPDDDTSSADRLAITRVDFTASGELFRRGTLAVRGAFPAAESVDPGWADLDDGLRLVLVACASRACSPDDPTSLITAELGDVASASYVSSAPLLPPRLLSRTVLTRRGGPPIARFAGGAFVYAAPDDTRSAPSSELIALRFTDAGAPFEAGRLKLRGKAAAIVPRGVDRAVVIAAGPKPHAEISFHEVLVGGRGALRMAASVALHGARDWTWTPAFDDARSVSFDPSAGFVAVPFTSFTEADRTYETGVVVVDLAARRARATAMLANDGIDRVVFVDGRLVAFGSNGAQVLEHRDLETEGRVSDGAEGAGVH